MTTKTRRLAEGGRIDRSTELSFTVDGQRYVGHPGDTLASALLAAGVMETGPSIYLARPRGIVAGTIGSATLCPGRRTLTSAFGSSTPAATMPRGRPR